MADKKISQLTAKGTPIAATDLVEISESNGAGGYVTKSVTGANILASKQDTLVSGTNIKTINGSSVLGSGNLVVTGGATTQIGSQIGGGIVVAVFVEGGVNKALVASLTNLSAGIQWTVPAKQGTLIGATGQSFFDGLTNTNAIIAQTGAAATTLYAAGLARLFAGGGFSDWYLPSIYELNMCYYSAAIVNKILGSTNGFVTPFNNYWSSTESSSMNAYRQDFSSFTYNGSGKFNSNYVRAVRIHTI